MGAPLTHPVARVPHGARPRTLLRSGAMLRRLQRFALRAVLPRGGPLPGIDDTDVEGFLDRFDAEAPAAYRLGLLGGAALIALTPPLTLGRMRPAPLLSPDDLDAHVTRLAGHRLYPVRQAMFAVKMVAGLCWGADPVVRARLGLAPLGPDPGTWRGDSSAAPAPRAIGAADVSTTARRPVVARR